MLVEYMLMEQAGHVPACASDTKLSLTQRGGTSKQVKMSSTECDLPAQRHLVQSCIWGLKVSLALLYGTLKTHFCLNWSLSVCFDHVCSG